MTKLSIYSIASKNIKAIRLRSGVTQVELAAKVGVSQPYIQKIEHEMRSLKVDILEKIASALGVEFYDLVCPSPDTIYRKIPLSGVVNFLEEHERQGGITIEYPEHIVFETQRGNLLAFWVWDESMNHYVPKESVIVVDTKITDPKLLHKKLVVALVDGRLIFGRWNTELSILWAMSHFDEKDFSKKATFDTQILGRVISFTKTYEAQS